MIPGDTRHNSNNGNRTATREMSFPTVVQLEVLTNTFV
jgi:hypothetical protein